MIRLDSLSWPALYETKSASDNDYEDVCGEAEDAAFSRAVQDDGEGGVLPAGWLRVQPAQGNAAQTWAEFLTPSGCLRRYKDYKIKNKSIGNFKYLCFGFKQNNFIFQLKKCENQI